jgi:hypothetical protein
LFGYKALLAMVESEDFSTMRSERMPVVIAQITSRLERLGRMLRQARGHGRVGASLH